MDWSPARHRLYTSEAVGCQEALDIWYDMTYHIGMKTGKRKPNLSVRMEPEALHQARVAAVTQRKTLGVWLEEAISEKLEREQGKKSRKGG